MECLASPNPQAAGGSVGVGRVARAATDGYSLVVGIQNTHVLNGVVYTLQYDPVKDFEPIALTARTSPVIVAKKAMPARGLNELIAWLKANPNKASQATAGVGSPQHMSGLFFQSLTGTEFQFVPYRGAAPAMHDLMSGQVDMDIDSPVVALPQMRAGTIRGYAIAAKHRLVAAPEIPTTVTRSILMTAEALVDDRYILATGAAGAARLALLDQVYGPDAERIMTAIGIPRGGRVADIGCGTGNTARWFANMVGPEGQIAAVDVSADQLAVARSSAEAHGLANIHFVRASAYDTGLPRDHFDVVHCRLLLCHLVRPLDALREMAAIARPGGLVICFDLDITGLFSVPATECYVRLQALFASHDRLRGVDGTLGLNLPRLFRQVGLVEPDIAFIHPVYLRGEGKRIAEYSFFEASPHVVRSGLTTDAELKRLAAALAAVAADETIMVAQSRMPAAWARKPG